MPDRPLAGHVALVAGATRGTGRGIALALGDAGATVYCTGRSVRASGRGTQRVPRERAFVLAERPETIEQTAELVTARGGRGIAVRVDHTDAEQVRALFARVERDQDGRLDILVNDIWGGEALSQWGTPYWELDLDKGFAMMDGAVRTHIITSRYGAPLLVRRRCGLIVEVTDGTGLHYRGTLFYSLCKVSAIHLALAMAGDLQRHLGQEPGVAAVALTPGFLRSEAMLDHFGVTEASWRDADTGDPKWAFSETPLYAGRAVVALATDPKVGDKAGRALSTWELADEYGFTDADGTRPHWGRQERG